MATLTILLICQRARWEEKVGLVGAGTGSGACVLTRLVRQARCQVYASLFMVKDLMSSFTSKCVSAFHKQVRVCCDYEIRGAVGQEGVV
jgi:hypothetical protein